LLSTTHGLFWVAHFLHRIALLTMKTPGAVLLAPSPSGGEMTKAEMEQKYNAMYYLKGAAAGGICCSITHGALTPVDVVVR
jgi:solute carrier family 25 phosphate transporter 3